jgi:nitroreductase
MAERDEQSCLTGVNRHGADMVDALIMARRSIRRYTGEPVPEAWIEAVLRCGVQAPSPSNSQPVRFARIASQAMRAELHQALLDGHARLLARNREKGTGAKMRNRINAYRRYAEFMVHAPVLMAVGVTTVGTSFAGHLAAAGLTDNDPRQGTDADITVGLVLQGILLKAQALGLGSCILTAPLVFIHDVDRILGLPDFQTKCFLTLGFAAESPAPGTRLPLEAVYKEI